MEAGWKNRIRRAGVIVLSYVVISLIAVLTALIRQSVRGTDSNVRLTWWEVLQFFIVPGLFLAAGYIGTAKCGLKRLNGYRVLLAAVVFSALLLGLWYVWLEGYVLCNLPAAEGSYAADLLLRKSMITYGYEYTYLANTDTYRYVVLPLIHFGVRILYWLCYLWGNRICISSGNHK